MDILTNPYYNNGIAKINYVSNNGNINQNNTFIVPETNSSRNNELYNQINNQFN